MGNRQEPVTRWNQLTSREEPCPEADAFLEEIIRVCKLHGLWLGHEDYHGGFIVQSVSTEDWLRAAATEIRSPKPSSSVIDRIRPASEEG